MKRHYKKRVAAGFLSATMALALLAGCGNQTAQNTSDIESESSQSETQDTNALSIVDQGVFSAGGVVLTSEGTFDPVNGQYDPTGQTSHADHASVLYQVPEDSNGHAMVFLHGFGQSRTGWMSTPDGRNGWNDLFLRRGYSTYLVDQPRRGEAGQASVTQEISTATQDQAWFTQFRMGRWTDFNEGSQFPQDEASIDQFFRQMTPDTGTIDFDVITDAMVEVFEQSGPGVLITHSQGGFPGWTTTAASDNVEAVVAIEPGGFPFPESEMPDPIEAGYYTVEGVPMADEDFDKLIEKPIIVYFGDYIPEESDLPAETFWRGVLDMGRQFAEVVNERSDDCTVIYLPDEGITGNSHFMFQELNNQEIADHIYAWLEEHDLG